MSETPKSSKSRVRQQRKFGEVVTTDKFLDEIKRKAQKKSTNRKLQQHELVQSEKLHEIRKKSQKKND